MSVDETLRAFQSLGLFYASEKAMPLRIESRTYTRKLEPSPNEPHTCFFDLSTELRLRIFELALKPEAITCSFHDERKAATMTLMVIDSRVRI